jgi:hypothetical protein
MFHRSGRRDSRVLSYIPIYSVLSIPAMPAEPERLFSGAKITITDRRNRLGIESIEAIECLKSWLVKVILRLLKTRTN